MDSSLISSDSTLAFPNVKLSPYRITTTPFGKTIYEFWRGNPKGDGPKETAMIVFNKGKTEFNLHYYPLNSKELQIVENLPVSKLQEAAENLKSAGFI